LEDADDLEYQVISDFQDPEEACDFAARKAEEMAKILISPEFRNDLIGISDYLFYLTDDPERVDKLTESLLDAVDQLAVFPKIGKKLYLPGSEDSGYRCVVHKQYMIVYIVREETVYVARIAHTSKDYLRRLFPRFSSDKQL
jgi:plasmid stabilization system protein ParE